MKWTTLMCVPAVVLFASLAIPTQLAAQDTHYRLIDIGTLGGPTAYGPGNGEGSQLLNNAGVVGGSADTSAPDPNAPNCFSPDCFLGHAFRWEGGVLTDLGTIPGGENSGASSINARGWIAGGSTTAEIDPFNTSCGFHPLCPQFHGALWKEEKIIDIGTLGEGLESNTLYINNAGAVVGFSTINTSPDPFSFLGAPTHAFIWRNGVMRDLGTLGGPDSFPSGNCNNQRNDLVAGGSFTDSTPNPATGLPTQHAFLWENGTMIDIPTLGGTLAMAECANNEGQVIGQSNLAGDVEQHAFSWEHGILTDLGTLGGAFSMAVWLNNAGEAVGGALTANEFFHATLWRKGVIGDLGTLPGDCISVAKAINSRSQVVGQSINCDTGISETVLWDNGSTFDLGIASNEPLNINDRGEITGVYVPAGCDNSNLCSHAFVLIPCASGQGCEQKGKVNAQIEGQADTTTLTQRREITKAFVANLRARLAQQHHFSAVGAPRK